MDAIREQVKKPFVVGIAGFIIGLILGWFVIGWGLWPVQWSDAAPQHLRQDLKADYLRMAIDSYTQNKDATLAKQRFEALGEDANSILAQIETEPQYQAQALVFSAAIQVTPGAIGPLPPESGITPEEEKPTGGSLIRNVLLVMCGAVLLVAAGLVALYLLRKRQVGERSIPPAMQAQPAAHDVEWGGYEAGSQEAPMIQFMASYKLGDDLFDDSFSIDSPAGEFLGECGVGISETIGVGDPKKVTAFEAWLFDKNDIQTVTKVLMSEHAFHDETIYQRLAAKGEPILAEPGAQIVLETQTLQMVVRVVDMGYGDGALPAHSYFDRLVLELAVWAKG
jgi:hypothetical protein